MEPVTATLAALGFLKGMYDTFSKRGREKRAAGVIGKHIRALKKQREAVPEFFESLRGLASEGAAIERGRAELSFEGSQRGILDDLMDIRTMGDVTKSRSGFEVAGTAGTALERGVERQYEQSEFLAEDYRSALDQMEFNLKSQFTDIDRAEIDRLNQLENQIYNLRTQKKILK